VYSEEYGAGADVTMLVSVAAADFCAFGRAFDVFLGVGLRLDAFLGGDFLGGDFFRA
jgi:hypothetical protein